MNKKIYVWLAGLVLASLILSACEGGQAAVQRDVLSLNWDQVIEESKTDGEVVFYSWLGEEYWKEAARLFT